MNPPLRRRFLTATVLRVFLVGTGVVAVLVPAGAVGPLIKDAESFAGGSVIEGQNTGVGGTGVLGSSSTNGGNGVVGSAITTTARVGSVGVRGTANAQSGYGVYGSGASPNSSSPSIGVVGISTGTYGLYGTTQSALFAAVLGFNPTSTTGIGVEGYASGNGVLGISGNSNGVVGQTLVNGFAGQSGVLGQDLSTDGDANAGVSGDSNNGTGVGGYSLTGSGLYGNSTMSDGVQGVSTSGDGVVGQSTSSAGMVAVSYATPAPAPTSSSSPPAAPPVLGIDSASGAPAIEVEDNNRDPIFSLDGSGNMIMSGNLTVDGVLNTEGINGCGVGGSPCSTPLVRAQKTAANVSVGTYAPEQTVRTLEDVGEAQLVNGSAYVRMDAAFASAVDQKSSYLVFITPQGDTRGLYVTGKTRAGFTVRETENGHSSLAFDYRIAAKPYGDTDARLPVLAANANRSHLPRPLAMPRALLRAAQLQSKRPLHMPTHNAGFIPKAPRPLVQPIAIR